LNSINSSSEDKIYCYRNTNSNCKAWDLLCWIDPDCNDMIDNQWRTDGNNYFVAGKRVSTNAKHWQTYYVINWKLFDPWISTHSNSREIDNKEYASKRNFVTIKNNIVTLKKMKNIKLVDQESGKTKYTLLTCDINLNKIQ